MVQEKNSVHDDYVIQSESQFFLALEQPQKAIQVFHFEMDVDECSVINNVILEMLSGPIFISVSFFHVKSEECLGLLKRFEIKYLPALLIFRSRQLVEKIEGFNIPEFTSKLKACVANAVWPAPTESIEDRIKRLVNSNKVVLFMKGIPSQPKCGFSHEAVKILTDNDIPFVSFDVLCDEDLRQGLKKFSDWPTFPQLYINQNFIGGLDIMKELAETKELHELVKDANEWDDAKLKALVNQHPVMIFIKGTKTEPKCKFSKTALDLLNKTEVEYGAFDILSNETVRQKLKEFSDWPTYPQLYVHGKLIGGVDVMKELDADGELVKTLTD